jgi:mRNA interferase MazF
VPVLTSVVVAPASRTVRGIASEVPLGRDEGLPEDGVASCDNLLTVPKDRFEDSPVGELDFEKTVVLDGALRFALEINY